MNAQKDKSIFYNADYVVVEYMDIIKSPSFVLLKKIRDQLSKEDFKLKDIIKVNQIEDLSDNALAEWYINRKYQNIFKCLMSEDITLTEDQYEEFLKSQLSLSNRFFIDATPLPFLETLMNIKKLRMINDVIIYAPYCLDYIEEDLNRITNSTFTYMDNFDEVIDLAKNNSTYFLSDITKILQMKEKDCLKYSSVTIPMDYRYNKKNQKDFLIDYDELIKTDIFKLSFFYALLVDTEGDM